MVKDTFQLIDAVKQMYPVVTFFKDRYFPDGRSFFSEEVLIDSKKQGKKIAPFVIPMINGITMEDEGFKTDRIKAPTIAVKMPITAEDLEKRAFGESPDSNKSPEDRQTEVEADHLDELRNAIFRRQEKMCVDIITTGEVVVDQYASAQDAAAGTGAVQRKLCYYEGSFGNRYVLGKKLSVMTAAEKIDALYGMANELHKRGFKAADFVITSDVAAILFGDKDFLDYYDKRRVDIGSLRPIETPDGVVLNGTIDIRGVMLNIFTYDEYFVDLDGQTKAFLPAGTMAMLTPGLGKTAYGQVSFVQGETMKSYADRIIPRIVADENTSIIEVQEFSRPVPYPEFIDGWVVADATKAN